MSGDSWPRLLRQGCFCCQQFLVADSSLNLFEVEWPRECYFQPSSLYGVELPLCHCKVNSPLQLHFLANRERPPTYHQKEMHHRKQIWKRTQLCIKCAHADLYIIDVNSEGISIIQLEQNTVLKWSVCPLTLLPRNLTTDGKLQDLCLPLMALGL